MKIEKTTPSSWDIIGASGEENNKMLLGEIFQTGPDTFIYRIAGKITGLPAGSFEDAKRRLCDLIKQEFGNDFR